MIVGAVLRLFASILRWLVDLLPEGSWDLPTGGSLATAVGSRVGPLDRFVPIIDALKFLGWFTGVYMPVVLTYSISKWVYRHLPVVGKG